MTFGENRYFSSYVLVGHLFSNGNLSGSSIVQAKLFAHDNRCHVRYMYRVGFYIDKLSLNQY